jgi:acyl transferase domain-containing protein
MVEPILQTFENCVAEVERHPPSIPFISNVSGQWITDDEATSPAYWRRHLRKTVRFGDGLGQVLVMKNRFLLEVGPGRILTTLAKQRDRCVPAVATLSQDRDSQFERRSLLDAVGQLWSHGAEIDWMPLHEDRQPRRVPLPAYIFDHKRYWIDRKVRLFSAYPALLEDREVAKVDVRNVDEPVDVVGNHNQKAPSTEFAGPQGEIAVRLRQIWKSYLGIENIGVRDNFFELGGDSLLAGRVHSQIRQEFNVQLPLARMFELATIRHISLYIAITRDPGVIDTLSEQDVDDVLAVMESWPAEMRPGIQQA